MCGIVGYVGPRDVRATLLEGLQKLEYRGYDSAGISVLDGDRIDAVRAVGNLSALRTALDERAQPGAVALAEPRHELQWIAPVAIARAEAAWLEGRQKDAVRETELAYEDAKRLNSWYLAGLSYWRWRAGVDEPIPSVGSSSRIAPIAWGYTFTACTRSMSSRRPSIRIRGVVRPHAHVVVQTRPRSPER